MRSEPPGESDRTDPTARTREPPARGRPAIVALTGNPNTGKTTLFNALTGYRRHVANYPGVTVDVGRGAVRGVRVPMELLDLPGTYSLAAVSPDEMAVTNVTCGRVAGERGPDCILAIADASNLPRNLYLISQLLELGLPVVIALNMVDIAQSRGITFDCERLSQRLGIAVVPVVATRKKTIPPLVEALERAASGTPPPVLPDLPPMLIEESAALRDALEESLQPAEALRVLLDRDGHAEQQFFERGGSPARLAEARERLAQAGIDGPAAEVRARYRWINRILEGIISRPETPVRVRADRVDRILTHKLGGAVFLLAVLYVVFESIFRWARPLMETIERAFAWLSAAVATLLPEGVLQSLVVDGIIGGVGGVLVFLPQIVILFAFIAILEDCGYLARAAYMADRLMRSIGLSGRAFIPLLSSFACAVPAIMGTRVIADRRERFVAILIAPFMSCSARLPIYVLLIGAFVGDARYLGGLVGRQALVMLAMYLVGVVVAVPAAWLLKRTVFAGPSPGFFLELPSYKWPRLGAVWQRMYFGGRKFVINAGTVIFAVNLVVWALGYFPRSTATWSAVQQQAQAQNWDEQRVQAELAGAYLRDSFLGRMGRAIEPAIEPIGWDWRIGVGVIASFPAREVIVATLGTIFNLGAEQAEGSVSLRTALKQAKRPGTDQPLFTLPVALSIMVFFALCAQCTATLVVLGKEMGSWLWSLASFASMTTIAYLAALGVATAARALGL